MCTSPIKILAKEKSKQFGQSRMVPCGYCPECISSKSTAWAVRLIEEEKNCTNAFFVTLTYNDENLPLYEVINSEMYIGINNRLEYGEKDNKFVPILWKADLQNYIKRIRKENAHRDFKYYAVGEYGTKNNRPHYHALLFNCDIDRCLQKWSINGEIIGTTKVGNVTDKSIRYVTNYVINKKRYAKRKMFPEFAIMSKGLGKGYIDKFGEYHRKNLVDEYRLPNGTMVKLPRYWKERIFSQYELKNIGRQNEIKAMEKVLETNHHEKTKYNNKMFNRNKKSRTI